MPEGKRPLTVDELRPFFRPEAAVELELALTRYHLAVATEQLAEAAEVAAEPDRELVASNGSNVTLTDDIK